MGESIIDSNLTLVTVLYEGASTLERTIPTWITALRGTGIRCVIIDNSRTDDVMELIQELDWQSVPYSYSRRNDNPGFATSANAVVMRSETPWVFLLNPDVFLAPEQITAVQNHAREKVRSSSHAPTAVSMITNGEHTCGISLDRLGYFSDRPVISSQPCLGPSGGAALFERKAFLAFGGFDDDLFAWGEDAGLAIRMYAAGVRTQELILGLDHEGGHSVASLAGQRMKARLLARNRILVMRRNFAWQFQMTVGLAQIAMILANGVRKVLLGTGRQHYAGVVAGFQSTRGRARTASPMTLTQFRDYHRVVASTAPGYTEGPALGA